MLRTYPSIPFRAEVILTFWFGTPESTDYGQPRKQWFIKSAEFDQRIHDNFLDDYGQAAIGHLDDWQESTLSCLALVLLLDQIPRNLFRRTTRAYATDAQALAIAQHAVAQGFDEQVLPVQQAFFYMPFEHSEALAMQSCSVALFQRLEGKGLDDMIDYAKRHHAIIERFGRFPHRNEYLGRTSSPEEQEFLQQRGSLF